MKIRSPESGVSPRYAFFFLEFTHPLRFAYFFPMFLALKAKLPITWQLQYHTIALIITLPRLGTATTLSATLSKGEKFSCSGLSSYFTGTVLYSTVRYSTVLGLSISHTV